MNTTGTDTKNTSGLVVTNKCLPDREQKISNGKLGNTNRNDLNEKENQNYSHENSFNEMTKGGVGVGATGAAVPADDDVVLDGDFDTRHTSRRLNGNNNINNLHHDDDIEHDEMLDGEDDNPNHNDPNEFVHSENYDENDEHDQDDEDFFNEKNSHSYHHNPYNQNRNGNRNYMNNHAGVYENGELDENELNENEHDLVEYEEEDFFNENNNINNHQGMNGRNGVHYDDQDQDDVQDVEDYDDDIGEEDDEENGATYYANKLNQAKQAAFNNKSSTIPLINPDNHYERQYACKQCEFITNNPRAVLYHRKEFHKEKINVHECSYCQYASQYSGKVERHAMLRHKAEMAMKQSSSQFNAHNMLKQRSDNFNQASNKHQNNEEHSASPANGALNLPAKFQCNQCPCKYKRSSDLSKHLRLKHALNLNNLNAYMNVRNASNGQQQNWKPQHQSDYNDNNNEDDDFDAGRQQNQQQQQQQSRVYSNRNFNQVQKKIVTTNDQVSPPSASSMNNQQSPPQPGQHNIGSSSASSCSSSTTPTGMYQCPYCTYCVSITGQQHGEYIHHVKDHLCGKAFRCVLCNSVYKYRGDCVVHLKRKHQKADTIAHTYVDKFNLDNLDIGDIYGLLKPKQHDEPENEEKLFGCAFCDYKANYKGDVYKHQTRRHPGTPKSVKSLARNGMDMNNSSLNSSSYQQSPDYKRHYSHQNGVASNRLSNNYNDDMDGDFCDEENGGVENDLDMNDDMDHQPWNGVNGDEVDYNEEEEDEDFFNERTGGGQNEFDDSNMMNGDNNNNNNSQDDQVYDDQEQQEDQMGVGASFNTSSAAAPAGAGRYPCTFCPFQGKNHAKLQLHLATHYNLKQFMCPICKRRANFKWDIQKHLRKIHNDYESEVICLSESEARRSIGTYIETKPYNTMNGNALLYERKMNAAQLGTTLGRPANGAANFKFALTRHAIRERKYKCSLCMRTSKWQWDIKKHMRTVHKGQEGDVIVLDEKDIVHNNHHKHLQAYMFANGLNGLNGNSSTFKPTATLPAKNNNVQPVVIKPNPNIPASLNQSSSIGSDTTGNKKFCCTLCPYRSNWKADIYRHLRKRHHRPDPKLEDVIVLSAEEAANTLEEYERLHGINIRKRSRLDANDASYRTASLNPHSAHSQSSADSYGGPMVGESKRFKSDSSSVVSSNSSSKSAPIKQQQQQQQPKHQQQLDEEQEEEPIGEDTSQGVERLPVSIAELNIKPYKCLKCGFRSDRKSDTLRHIRVKHALQPLQAFKFLRIMSIKEASETIDQYESTRLYKKVRPVNRDYNLINNLVTSNALPPKYNTKPSNNNSLSSPNKSQSVVKAQPLQPQIIANVNGQPAAAAAASSSAYASSSASNLSLPVNNITTNNNRYQKSNAEVKLSPSERDVQPSHLTNKSKFQSLDYYRCPICVFKHRSRLVMKKHLNTHYHGNQFKQNPVYQCNICAFKSEWQYAVKKHIVKSHLTNENAACVKLTGHEQQPHQPRNQAKKLRINFKFSNTRFHKHSHEDRSDSDQTESNSHSNPYFKNATYNDNYNDDDEEEFEDQELTYENGATDFDETNTYNESPYKQQPAQMNYSLDCTQDDSVKVVETIMLTDYDGVEFPSSYLVSGGTNSLNNKYNVNSTVIGAASASAANAQPQKKMFFCQACPYNTKNYCNLKQHLLQHRFREGYFKCRYCAYFVSMIRLLKQHEILHSDYVPRENIKGQKPTNGGSSSFSFPK